MRAWPGVVTVGVLAPDGNSRTEDVVDAATGATLRHYPAAVFGGAVAASSATTVIVGRRAVTAYDNATGHVRWQRATAGRQTWQADGPTLYLAESKVGSLGSAGTSAMLVIDLDTGRQRMLGSPRAHPFSGTLALAADGVMLFASPSGVTAYSGTTGGLLWALGGAVPEGTDPGAGLLYLSVAGGGLRGVTPLSGTVRATVPAAEVSAAGGVYVVRDGIAFGLDSGASGSAWEYSTASGRVRWASATVGWPHFFSDLSGLGGSAAASGGLVVISACPHLAASSRDCADPELIAYRV